MKHLNKSTYKLLIYQGPVQYFCTKCAMKCLNEMRAKGEFWDQMVKFDKTSNKTCSWCKSDYRQLAYKENRIVWNVFENDQFLFTTNDKHLAFKRNYKTTEVILK